MVAPTTVAQNTFEGGTSGVTLTTANGSVGGTNFDVVNLGSGGAIAFDNTKFMHGAMSMKVTQATSIVNFSWAGVAIPSALPNCVVQVYVWLPTAGPTVATQIIKGYSDTAATAPAWAIAISTSRQMVLLAPTATVYTSTALITGNQWVRFEVIAIASASLRAAAYAGDTTTPMVDSDVVSVPTIPSTQHLRLGIATSSSGYGPLWFDDPKIGSGTEFYGVATSGRPSTVVANPGGVVVVGGTGIAAVLADNLASSYVETAAGPAGASFTVGGFGALSPGTIVATHTESQAPGTPIIDCLFEVLSGPSTVVGSHTVALSTTVTDYTLTITNPTVTDWSDLRTRTTYTQRAA